MRFLILAILFWAQLAPPAAADRESGAILARTKEGEQLWTNEWTMDKVVIDGRPAVRFTENGEGVAAPFRQRVRWSVDAIWTAGAAFRPLRVEKTVTALDGKVLQREFKQFNAATRTVEFRREEAGSPRPFVKKLDAPADTLAVEGLAAALRSLPFDGPPARAHLLSNEPRLYEVTFAVRGRERVRTPGGEVESYRVELVPDAGILNIFRVFFPKAFFWFAAEAPHFWVRYEGPENGPGTEAVVLEMRGR
jgi:hypothetical protein